MRFLNEANQSEIPMHDAVNSGSLAKVKEALKNGHSVNEKTKTEQRPCIFFSLARGYTSITQFLIDNGADINFVTPQTFIDDDGKEKKCYTLEIDKNTHKEIATPTGNETVYHWAAKFPSNVDFVRYFLKKATVDPNLKNYRGYTALMAASGLGLEEIAEALMTSDKVDINITAMSEHGHTSTGVNAFLMAVSDPPDVIDPLQQARLRMVKSFVENGADITNININTKNNCAHIAARRKEKSAAMLEYIINVIKEQNKNELLDAINATNDTPLTISIKQANLDKINLLLRAGVDTTGAYKFAIEKNDPEILESILKYTHHGISPKETQALLKTKDISDEIKELIDEHNRLKSSFFFKEE